MRTVMQRSHAHLTAAFSKSSVSPSGSFKISPLWRLFSKSSVLGDLNAVLVWTVGVFQIYPD